MTRRRWAAGLALATGIALTPATVQAQDAKQQAKCDEAVQLFRSADRDMAKFFETAVGYAIFPSVGKGAFIVGGAAGTGCLYDGGAIIGQAKLVQVTVGFQLGGQAYAEIIFFQTHDALASFKSSSFEMSAQVSAVAAASGASANAKYELGVLVFTIAKGGLMYEASVGGQKFTFKPMPESSSGEAAAPKKD